MSVANYGGLPVDDLPGVALGPARRPAMAAMPMPELKYYSSTFIVGSAQARVCRSAKGHRSRLRHRRMKLPPVAC